MNNTESTPDAQPTLFERLRGSSAARDGIYVLAAQAIGVLIALAADSLLFRDLQKSENGIFNTALGLRSVLLSIADCGMAMATVRVGSYFVAKGMRAEAHAVFRRALVFRWLAALVVCGLCALLSKSILAHILDTPSRPYLVYACIGGLLGMTTVSWGLDVAQCRRRMGSYFAQNVGDNVLRALAIMAVLRGMETPSPRISELILWMMAAGVIVAALISVLVEREVFADAKGFGLAAPPSVSDELHGFIPYAAAATFLGMVAIYVEIFLLKNLRGSEETAIFAGARRLGSLLPLLTAGLTTVMLPRASALQSHAECAGYIRKALKFTVPLSVIVCGGLALAASLIVPLMWGHTYDASIVPLRWMCLAYGLSFIATPLSYVFFPLKRPGTLVILNGLTLALSIGVGIWMVTRYGALGAAWSMLLVRATMALIMGLVLWRIMKTAAPKP